MKKFLPIFFAFIFACVFLLISKAHAQTTPAPGQQLQQGQTAPDGSWVIDPEVTFIGKNAARSGNLLDFTLQNYNWVCVKQVGSQCDNSNNPLAAVWLTTVTYIVVPLLFVVILAAAIVIIITRGRSVTVMRFLPRFIAILLLIVFSFALLQFFYQFFDVIQGFFLRSGSASCPPECISQKDLLYVGWHYETFEGLRRVGDIYTESAFISLLLTKLTALTYYVMVGILYLRRIILWLFIIVSPIFPLLLLFYPVRNTGKIWIGEFFRWLLYAPLFAIFLKGLVSLWRNQIPLVFNNPGIGDASKIIYPTAVNILLGGPKQFVTPTNSVNLTETFALYVVSLLMLWGVIILPWILLQIFLDYASNIGVGDNVAFQKMVNMVNKKSPPPASPTAPSSGGSAISLPFTKKFNLPIAPPAPTGMAREIPTSVSSANFSKSVYMPTAQVKAQVLGLTNLSLPSMRDIAKYDTSLISRDKDRQKEVTVIKENLEKIANPSSITSTTEREKFTEIREKLTQESKGGNTLATSIINAASTVSKRSAQANTNQLKSILTQIANPTSVTSSSSASSSVVNRAKIENMNQSLVKAKKEGNTLAASILSVTDKTPPAEIEKLSEKIRDARLKGEPIAAQIADVTARQETTALPVVNRVQTVSKEDYEAVKDMWKDNYRNLEVPEGMAGTRAEWIKEDMTKIENIINLLSSPDEEQKNQGMQEVSSILPFLLVGGFSQTEIIAYLKAKLDAAKDVATEVIQDEEDKVEVKVKKTATTSQTLAASIPDESEDDESDLGNLSTSSTNITTPQVNAEILKMSNLEVPKLTDIVNYEMRHLTKDKKESERVEKMHDVLERIGNPENIQAAPERQQYETLRQKLTEESQKGNITADVILSAVSQLTQATGVLAATVEDIKTVLLQIANPETVSSADDKSYYVRLHEYLEKESKEKNNALAQKILTVSDMTKTTEIQEIKQQLMQVQQGGDLVLPQITEAANDFAKVKELRSVISQIISSSQVDNATTTKLNESIKAASSNGDGIATSLLSISDKVSDASVRQIYQKLTEAGQKGDSLAASVLSYTSQSADLSSGGQTGQILIALPELKTILQQISNPVSVVDADDKKYYSTIHEYLDKESKEKNNQIAQKILSVNEKTNISEIQSIKDQLMGNDANPAISRLRADITEISNVRKFRTSIEQIFSSTSQSSQFSQETISKLRNSLNEESKKGNKLASTVLSVNKSTSDLALMQIHQKLTEAAQKGDPLAKTLLSHVTKAPTFSATNRLQEVTPEEYKQAKELWEKAYRQYFVPEGYTEDVKGRIEWIQKDIADIEETIGLLESQDAAKKESGIKKVSGILPFLLLGGFSFDEMVTYLKTKLDAARSALSAIEKEEENSEVVDAKTSENAQDKELSQNIPDENDEKK